MAIIFVATMKCYKTNCHVLTTVKCTQLKCYFFCQFLVPFIKGSTQAGAGAKKTAKYIIYLLH